MATASTPTSADYLVDRRRLRRKLLAWRVAGFVLAAVIVVGATWQFAGGKGNGSLVPHIARVKITGLITGDEKTIKLLRDVEKSSAATGVILDIDSPGGTTVGAEKVYDAIRAVAAKKPVVAEVGTLAASGAYIAALGSDHIVARGNSLVGSIGVLFEFPNVSKLLATIGVDVEKIKSSPLKAEPDGFTPTSDAARAAIASIVSDSYAWFKGLVKDRRAMTDDEVAVVSDGRVFTARQGLPLKLIDQIGTEKDAVAWLETKGVAKDLPVRDWEPQSGSLRTRLFGAAASLADDMGSTTLGAVFRQIDLLDEAGHSDGLMSVWHAAPGSP